MIGDVLTSSILFEGIKKKYPNNPYINNFIFFTPKIKKYKLDFFKLLKQIRSEEYDVVIDVYGKISSAIMTYFSKAKIRSAYFKSHTCFLYSHPIKRLSSPINNSSLAIENRFKLLDPLGIKFRNISPKIFLEIHEIEKEQNVKFNANSTAQLRKLFFDKLNLPVSKKTPKGEPSTDKEVLEQLAKLHDIPNIISQIRTKVKLRTASLVIRL